MDGKKTEIITFRVSRADLDRIEAAAASERRTRADYVRMRLLDSVDLAIGPDGSALEPGIGEGACGE